MLNPRVFFDISIASRPAGRLVLELFADKLPLTVENFRCLATGETGLGYWLKPRWYQNSRLHKICKGFMCQGGDFNRGDGYWGESIYGQTFRDEGFFYKHSKRGVLSMANDGEKNSNNSQFFITFTPCPWLDKKHVVFGHVESGIEVLDAIEAHGTEGGAPRRPVVLQKTGEVHRLQVIDLQIPRPEPIEVRDMYSPIPDEVWKASKNI